MGPAHHNVRQELPSCSEGSVPDAPHRHGRDNKLHVWKVLDDSATKVRDAASESGLPLPELEYSMDVNALNYCRFSLLPLSASVGTSEETRALLAVPNLVESALVCVPALLHFLALKLSLSFRQMSGRCQRATDFMPQ